MPTKKDANENLEVKQGQGAKHLHTPKDDLKLRNSPRLFSEMVSDLTEDQKKWVQKIGFGRLLDFSLELIPANLAYNDFQIFDPNTVSLNLKNELIPIME